MNAHRTYAEQSVHYFVRDHRAAPTSTLDAPAAWAAAELESVEDEWSHRLADDDLAELADAADAASGSGRAMEEIRADDAPDAVNQ